MGNTKIVATLGPSSDNYDTIKDLIVEGVNVFRLNLSHGDHSSHSKTLGYIKKASTELSQTIGVLADICGPKIRVGEIDGTFKLKTNDILNIHKKNVVGYKDDNGEFHVSMNQPSIINKLVIGNDIYFYDGLINTKVIEASDELIKVKLSNSGILTSKKGMNFPNTRLNLNVITKKDEEDIEWAVKNGVEFLAVSFVQNADDVRQARKIIDDFGGSIDVISKIEKFDAVENLDEILEVSDGIMVARGDLGIEVPYYKVPFIQKLIISKANALGKPVITATQMLLSMTTKSNPTRAEVSDVANAVMDGTDAVMLSEESAIGEKPVNVVATMKRIASEVEEQHSFANVTDRTPQNSEAEMIAHNSVQMAKKLKINAIIGITSSGKSIKNISKYRPRRPILAVTHDKKVLGKLTLSWGVFPMFAINQGKIETMVNNVVKNGIDKNILSIEKTYIINVGYPSGISGTTNMIHILNRDVLKYYLNK